LPPSKRDRDIHPATFLIPLLIVRSSCWWLLLIGWPTGTATTRQAGEVDRAGRGERSVAFSWLGCCSRIQYDALRSDPRLPSGWRRFSTAI
jgi:hypothetical protein